ncbi:unnamed protein product [Sphagnum tenellum]
MESKVRSFVRKGEVTKTGGAGGGYVQAVGAKPGCHGVSLVSSGLDDLDHILPLRNPLSLIVGGGIPVGGLVMVMEDIEAPHHMPLLRFFMAQGLVHSQPLFFATPLPSPQAFLGTLPAIASRSSGAASDNTKEGDLRIAWQYRRFLNEQQALEERRYRYEFCNDFDLRKPAERSLFTGATIKCESLARGAHLDSLLDHCRVFISNLARYTGEGQLVGRLAFQSLCAPQCMQSCTDWEMLRFLQSLKSLLRVSNAVALITFPATLLTPSMAIRWQHLADILISVEAVLDDNKEMAGMLTDYPDILGFLRIHKLASINTQVPTIPEAAMHAMKVVRRKKLVLERLLFAPVDATSGDSKTGGAAGLLCGRPANASSPLDF